MLLDEVSPSKVTPKGWQVQGRKRKARQVKRKRFDGTPVLSAVSQRRANVAEEEVEEEEIEDALLSDKKKRKKTPQVNTFISATGPPLFLGVDACRDRGEVSF